MTILVTIGIQIYWNIQNYATNKQRLINEVQISLDNSVEAYYAGLAKTDFFAFAGRTNQKNRQKRNDFFWKAVGEDSLRIKSRLDSLFIQQRAFNRKDGSKESISIIELGENHPSLKPLHIFRQMMRDSSGEMRKFANRLVIAAINDSINFTTMDSLLAHELKRKDITIGYKLVHCEDDSILYGSKGNIPKKFKLKTFSKSTYLPASQNLQLFFSNPTLAILKRSLTGILLSFVLSTAIILCLLHLLRIITKQKQLSEIKNDLISNITHEFKTPIATVTTAIEGIKNFNQQNDKVKTEKYLDISNQQLQKLNQMVEKLLETATLDNDKLIINKEPIDLIKMLKQLVEKYRMIAPEKELLFSANCPELQVEVDPFHFENAVANLIDNAIKYGGNQIQVNLNSVIDQTEITVADNGGNISQTQKDRIFEKFYRIPTGNQHDVKGFGIGLFYSKKIIEKHEGTLQLVADKKLTIFKIQL
ncbi:sensor histidine kinase [Flagellimonas sp.]|uniref:sensor histidine kinase n=1 Tax=Flagellimonas sp. TaxID=2058762 RepID=UPI003B5B45C0